VIFVSSWYSLIILDHKVPQVINYASSVVVGTQTGGAADLGVTLIRGGLLVVRCAIFEKLCNNLFAYICTIKKNS
jgi:hypothetical protein